MYCLKPLDEERILEVAQKTHALVTVEEHVAAGGLGSMVCCLLSERQPGKVACLTLPDAPVITGVSAEVFHRYGLDADGIVSKCMELLR